MIDERMRACIQECNRCHETCEETVLHCLEMGGQHAEPNHIRTMLDCAQICKTSADFMLRMSKFHGEICGVCADVCERCEAECERFKDDQMMQRCADACQSCARLCHEMAIQL
jgi:hypothetical protein